MNKSQVWYVTGASQGLGLTLVKELLKKGFRVAATSRNAKKLREAVGLIDDERFLPVAVDLNNLDCIEESVRQTVAVFGNIDVVVNNAGYGMIGTVEDVTDADIRRNFDVNVFATINVTRAVVPLMRKQGSGYIVNIGSVAGFTAAAGWSAYSAAKAAVAAFSEVLSADLKEFGIRVTVVEPSGFRTGFLEKNSLADITITTEGYEAVRSSRARYLAGDGNQPGDPLKAADILIALSEIEYPPLHLYLGKDAYYRASQKLSAMTEEIENWKQTSFSADFLSTIKTQ